MTKIITDEHGKLLGAAIVGAHAGELIHEFVLALDLGLSASELSRPMHIYPTLSQGNRRVAELRRNAALTPLRKRWLQRLFGLHG